MLDYGCNCLWSANYASEKEFGYHIDDLDSIGLSNSTIFLNEIIIKLFSDRLNIIYPVLPSFWSGEMQLFFQKKVKELYKNIIAELGDKFDIEISKSALSEMNDEIDIDKINTELKVFIENPVEYFIKNKIEFNDKQSLIEEVKREYKNWQIKESDYLDNNEG